MSLNASQYRALFTNAFGGDPSEFNVNIDASADVAVGKVGTHTVELQVVQQKPIAWMVDGEQLFEWPGILKPLDPYRAVNGETLRRRIA
jgi:hypothetical protein